MSELATSARHNGDHIDLLIIDNDIALTDAGCAALIDGRPSITQDLLHMIRDKGLLFNLVGERDREQRQRVYVELVDHIEDDERIVPGTTKVQEDPNQIERLWVVAESVEYGHLEFYL